MGVNRLDIIDGINKLNLDKKLVCIHSSLKSFGFVDGGARTIIDAFLDEGYTILAPTFSTCDYSIHPPIGDRPLRNGWDYNDYREGYCQADKIFTVDSKDISRKSLGAIPNEILNMPKSRRGYNPLNSFSAIGPMAERLISGQSAKDVYAPLKELYYMGGHIILMGVGLTSMTAIHYAEEKAGRNLFVRWAKDLYGFPMRVSIGSCSRGYDIFDPLLEKIEKNVVVGNSLWRVFQMRATIDICTHAIKENGRITHCNHEACVKCRDAVQGGPILD